MVVCRKAVVETAQGGSRKERREKVSVGGRHRVTPRGMAQVEVPKEEEERGRKLPDQGSQILIGHRATRGEVHRTHGVRPAKRETNGDRM